MADADWKGVPDNRPVEKGQAGKSTSGNSTVDWKGVGDNRPPEKGQAGK